jgi:hypothetical protein
MSSLASHDNIRSIDGRKDEEEEEKKRNYKE